MMTRVIPARDAGQIAMASEEAAALLREGQPVAVPTETVYGLACDALDARAAAHVFAAKERPSFDPLIVHIEDVAWIGRLARVEGSAAELVRALVERFWPGPLTLVLPSSGEVPDLVRSGLPTVALRCSAHPVLAAVLRALGRPVAAPSANRFGRISPVTAEHVVEELGGRIRLVLDAGPCKHGLESTIVAVGNGRMTLLRPGPVPLENLATLAPVEAAPRGAVASAPGMLEGHYAPRTPLRLLTAGEIPPDAAASALLAFGRSPEAQFAAIEELPADPAEAAPSFFSALRRLDASGVACIYAQGVEEAGLGLAIMDRLRRAAHE